jgi:hypothetical protein
MKHVSGLRLSLLVALGVFEVACGGNAEGIGDKATLDGCTASTTDPKTGLATCKEGAVHRPMALACGATRGASDANIPAPLPRADGSVTCNDDPAVCAQFQNGYCGLTPGLIVATCRSGCETDADCGSGSVCICDDSNSPTGGTCHGASCRTDADCGTDGLCAQQYDRCGTITSFSCLTSSDECASAQDCPGAACVIDESGEHRECSTAPQSCGRPFLVHEQARVAPVAAGNAWRGAQRRHPQTQHLSAAERASLAAHWTRMGQMEHASIAAFARFSLQLLALGAPPDLVEACTAALADETAHTKLCFDLASAYAGRSLGPGPLDIDGSLTPTDLADVVDLVIAEGCFGETSAALEALEAADTASDPVIVDAYTQIARDEQRHAELAFRFVRWAIAQDARIAARVRAALVLERAVSPSVRDIVESCLYGVLTGRAAA